MPKVTLRDEDGHLRQVYARLVEANHSPRFSMSQSLEARARKIGREIRLRPWDPEPLAAIQREIALSLDHLDGLRHMHGWVRSSLLQLECRVETQYLASALRHRYMPDLESQLDKLRRHQWEIEKERRQLATLEQMTTQPLLDRLLALLNQYRLLHL
jgi:hypothetical protein